jgi:hypothetical protein
MRNVHCSEFLRQVVNEVTKLSNRVILQEVCIVLKIEESPYHVESIPRHHTVELGFEDPFGFSPVVMSENTSETHQYIKRGYHKSIPVWQTQKSHNQSEANARTDATGLNRVPLGGSC